MEKSSGQEAVTWALVPALHLSAWDLGQMTISIDFELITYKS